MRLQVCNNAFPLLCVAQVLSVAVPGEPLCVCSLGTVTSCGVLEQVRGECERYSCVRAAPLEPPSRPPLRPPAARHPFLVSLRDTAARAL